MKINYILFIYLGCLISFSFLSSCSDYCRYNKDCSPGYCVDHYCELEKVCASPLKNDYDICQDNKLLTYCHEIENNDEYSDLSSDIENCGECGNKCVDTQTCIEGKCVCYAGDGDLCDGKCVNLKNDPENCGECENKCIEGQACSEGKCVCKDEGEICEGKCVNLKNDAENCGQCGNNCGDHAICKEGACKCNTDEGKIQCEDKCLNANELNISDCNICKKGWINFDGDWSNGCEADIIKFKPEDNHNIDNNIICNKELQKCYIKDDISNCEAGQTNLDGECIDSDAIVYILSEEDYLTAVDEYIKNNNYREAKRVFVLANDIDLRGINNIHRMEHIFRIPFTQHFHGMYHSITYGIYDFCMNVDTPPNNKQGCGLFYMIGTQNSSDIPLIEKLTVNVDDSGKPQENPGGYDYTYNNTVAGLADSLIKGTINQVTCNVNFDENFKLSNGRMGGCIGRMSGGTVNDMTCTGIIHNYSDKNLERTTGGCIGHISDAEKFNNIQCGTEENSLEIHVQYLSYTNRVCVGSIDKENFKTSEKKDMLKAFACHGIVIAEGEEPSLESTDQCLPPIINYQ